MSNTPQQAISDAAPALPYEVFEIRTLAVLGGVKLPVAYVGIVQTGGIQQVVADLQGQNPSCAVLRHCLEAAPSYSVRSMGWAPDQQGAEDLRRQLIAAHPLVLNKIEVPGQVNSIYEHYLREHAPKLPKNILARTLRCAGCSDNKERSEFYKDSKGKDPLCKECCQDAVARGIGRREYVRRRRNNLPLPDICPLDTSKKCRVCGRTKAAAKHFPTNKLLRGGYDTICKACRSQQRRLDRSRRR